MRYIEKQILYSYICSECDAEFEETDSNLSYCDSEKCVDKDHYLAGPYLIE